MSIAFYTSKLHVIIVLMIYALEISLCHFIIQSHSSLNCTWIAASSLSRSQSDVARIMSPTLGDQIEDKLVIWRGIIFFSHSS